MSLSIYDPLSKFCFWLALKQLKSHTLRTSVTLDINLAGFKGLFCQFTIKVMAPALETLKKKGNPSTTAKGFEEEEEGQGVKMKLENA